MKLKKSTLRLKKFKVNFDMTWSKDVFVTAYTPKEAKRKACEKFRVSRLDFKINVEKLDTE